MGVVVLPEMDMMMEKGRVPLGQVSVAESEALRAQADQGHQPQQRSETCSERMARSAAAHREQHGLGDQELRHQSSTAIALVILW